MSILRNRFKDLARTSLCALALLLTASSAWAAWVPGLRGGFLDGSSDWENFPAETNVYLDTHAATNFYPANSPDTSIWANNRTWVYWGEMYSEGDFCCFGEHIMDSTRLWIDGWEFLAGNDKRNFEAGQIMILPVGWHHIEVRFGHGGGQAGVLDTIFTKDGVNAAFGIASMGLESPRSMADCTYLADPGDGSLFRHDDGLGFDDALLVNGEPFDLGIVEPRYGVKHGLSKGSAVSCTAPETASSGGVNYRLTGYRVEDVDNMTNLGTNLVSSGATASLDYLHAGFMRRLTWLWEVAGYDVSASAGQSDKGSVTGGGAYPVGGTVTLTAVPVAGQSFTFWAGDLPEGIDVTAATITFPADRPRAIVANFGTSLFVSKTGSDTNDGASWETAFATLDKAVEQAADYSRISIGPGEYAVTAPTRLVVDKPVLVIGCGETSDDVVLTPPPDVIPGWILGVDHDEAVVRHLTLAKARRTAAYNSPNSTEATALRLVKGTVADCVIRDNDSGQGAVHVEGGLLEKCEIYGNAAGFQYTWTGHGGGVYASGGVVRDCIVSNNVAHHGAAGVMISDDALVTGCLIADNKGRYNTQKIKGAGVVIRGGVLENSIVCDNGALYSEEAGGIYMGDQGPGGNKPAPIVRNCVVMGNEAIKCGGVFLDKGRIVNCTLVDNRSISLAKGVSLYQKRGAACNNIILGTATTIGPVVESGEFTHNLVDDTALTASTIVHGNPQFMDREGRNYVLRPGSLAIDAGQVDHRVPYDLAGVSRPQGSGYDIGAFERVPGQGELVCSFVADRTTIMPAEAVTFTGYADGEDAEGLSYSWDFDDDGTVDATGAVVTWENVPAGRHPVRLTVSTTSGSTTTYCKVDGVSAVPTTTYVSTTGSGIYPFATPETATSDVQAAIDAVWATDTEPGKVLVAEGTYEIPALYLTLSRPIRLEGTGDPEKTVLKAVHEKTRRVILVDHKQAVVSGLTFSNGAWDSWTFGDSGPGGLRLRQGIVTNCVIRDNQGNDDAGGVEIFDGLLVDCRIYNNRSYRGNNARVSPGGGIRLRGGLVSGCIISNNAANGEDCGGGVYLNGGVLQDSRIEMNSAGVTDKRKGGGLYLVDGLVQRCVIRANTKAEHGGGVYMKGGTLRNCLVTENECLRNGGAIYQEGGVVEHCTVSGNDSTSLLGSGLYQRGGLARNNIIWDNGGGVGVEATANLFYQSGIFTTNVVSPATVGAGNIASDPLFTDPLEGNFVPGAGSPAIDAAATIEGVVDDLFGEKRPKDGLGDGQALPDIGCHEVAGANEGPLRCSFKVENGVGFDCVTPTLTAQVAGTGSDGELHYRWDLGGGNPGTAATDTPVLYPVFDSYGSFTVTLTVTAGGQSASSTVPGCVKVGAKVVHVNAEGANVWPYATAEDGATDIMEAMDSMIVAEGVRSEVVVHDGTYPVKARWIIITRPLVLRSENGPEKTILKAANPGGNPNRRVILLNNEDAIVSGLTMTGGLWDLHTQGDSGPGALRLLSGTVSNCIIRNNKGSDDAGGVEIFDGLMTDCLIYDNEAGRGNNASVGVGGGVTIRGGVLQDCVISNNIGRAQAGGLRVVGGTVRNCLVTGNKSGYKNDKPDREYAGALLAGGLIENCVFRDNVANGECGGVALTGPAVLRNCLLVGNSAKQPVQALWLSHAKSSVYNCTVASNGVDSIAGAVAAKLEKGTITNAIVYHNLVEDVSLADAVVAGRNCWPNVQDGIASDPLFRGPGDFHLATSSPCRNAGDNAPWADLLDPLDLDGNKRILFRLVDLGCYEVTAGNATILLMR